MNDTERAVLVDGRYNSDFHKGLVSAIEQGLEESRNSGFGDTGTVNRIAMAVTHYLLTSRPEPAADAVRDDLQEFADMFHFAWGLWAAQDEATPIEIEHLKCEMDDTLWSDMILKWSEMVEDGVIKNPGLDQQDKEIEVIKSRPAWLLSDHARAALQAAAVEPAADAVHSVHEALVNSAPGWIIDQEDGELFDMARAALQAAAVEPEPGLDELLDSVGTGATVSLHRIEPVFDTDPEAYWDAEVRVPFDGHNAYRRYISTGATRMAAITDAVRQATGAEGERE